MGVVDEPRFGSGGRSPELAEGLFHPLRQAPQPDRRVGEQLSHGSDKATSDRVVLRHGPAENQVEKHDFGQEIPFR